MPQQKGILKILFIFTVVIGGIIGGLSVLLNFIGGELTQSWLEYGFWNTMIAATLGLLVIVWIIMGAIKKAMAGGMPGGMPGNHPGM